MPLFSIIMPTRNRAHLLRYSLQSALEQTFDDYEVVVSDNNSSDNTHQAVQELGNRRVRYVRTDKVLSMPDNWEFALNQAQGQYVTYLCDDDALCPGALKRVYDAIDRYGSGLVALGSAAYSGYNWYDISYRNVLLLPTFTGREIKCDSRETLNHRFKFQFQIPSPGTLNSFCRREIIHQVRNEARGIFFLCPDYSSSTLILTAIPEWVYLDEPLRLQGAFAEGIGASTYYNRGEPFREFIREFRTDDLLTRVPLKIPVVTNYIAETLLTAKEKLPSKFTGIEIDWETYFIGCWISILALEDAGVRVEADKEEFFRIIAKQREEIQSRVRAYVIKHSPVRRPLKRVARRIIRSLPLSRSFESIIRWYRGDTTVLIDGERAGFRNILECARQLQSLSR